MQTMKCSETEIVDRLKLCLLQSVPMLSLVQEHEKVNGKMSANNLVTLNLKYEM